MLNPFPIQFLALFAYAILRIFVGLILMYLGASHIRNRQTLKGVLSFAWFPYENFLVWYVALLELILGTMFVIGFLTQVAALLTFFLSLKFIILNKHFRSPFVPGRLFYVLLLGSALSLFITGAGVPAFDLPL